MSVRGSDEGAREQLAAILGCMPDAALAVDERGRIVAVNEVLVELSGYEGRELIGAELELLVPSRLHEEHRAHREKFELHPCRRSMGDDFDIALRRKDGSECPIEVSLTPLRHAGAALVVAGVRDIAERRAVQKALASSERRFRALFDRNPAGIFRSTPDGRLLECNDAFARICGYESTAELAEHPLHGLYFDPADRERFVDELRRAGSLEHFEERLRSRDGHEVWVLTAATLLAEPEHGEVIQGALLDVTDRRRAESALAETEEHFRALVESIQAVVWRADARTFQFTYVSPRAEQLLGYPLALWLEEPGFWASKIHPDDRAEALAYCLRETAALRDHSFEYRMVRADGLTVWVHDAAHVVAEGGRPVGLVGVFLDLTERRTLEEQLRQALKMEAVGRLAGGIAHDFNNLMGVILGYTEMLIEQRTAEPDRTRLEEIRRASERAAALTRQLLAYSRRQVLQVQRVALNRLLLDFESMLQRVLGEDIRLEISFGPGLWKVLADPVQVEQILLNLAVNSRDAMPGGGVLRVETANVEIDAHFVARNRGAREGSYVRLRVSDNGEGMEPTTLAHVFEPFFTTKEPGQGTGLGLATVYGIVKQSGGYITVESQPGQGTTVAIYLPRCSETAEAEETAVAPAAATKTGGAETILLVEDARPFRRLVHEILAQAGYRVLEAASPGAALTLVSSFGGEIDLVLTDVVMPEMRGHELVSVLRAARPELRVVYMSGFSEDIVESAVHESFHFLQKPFTSELLLRTLREALAAPP